ncbi:MAG: hypothetical protein U0841_08115 [Chloroflexia bacterium]
MRPLRFGFKTTPRRHDVTTMLAIWEEADQIPVLEHAWLFDHFAPIQGDVVGHAWRAGRRWRPTRRAPRLRVGLMVTGSTYRHPSRTTA